jgi:hypothetical protein
MRLAPVLPILGALLGLCVNPCSAEPVWATGNTLLEVIRCDLQAHESKQKLSDYQTNAVCLLLGYFNGFAESAALASHYDATALPFFLPNSITDDEIERVVYDFLSSNPDKLNIKGGALVVAALARAFPNPTFKPPLHPAPGDLPAAPSKRVDGLSSALLSGS